VALYDEPVALFKGGIPLDRFIQGDGSGEIQGQHAVRKLDGIATRQAQRSGR
jgi:hypothetical protein